MAEQLDEGLRTALGATYAIHREVGAGGMARVYSAHDHRHDRQVAVKVLRPELTEALGRERFAREIHLAARLTHPNVLSLYDSGEADGYLYFVMPFMEGQTLRDKMTSEGPLDVDSAVRIACEVSEALDYAHRHDVVHRDIKPENILLHEGHAVVADFGVGKAILAASGDASNTLTQIGLTVGTPAYMSPEQAAGDDVDGRSDLFSLGCMLYEMLTGEAPFTGPTLQAVIARRFVHTPPTVATMRPGVSAAVSHAVERLMEKDPSARFESGAFAAAALRASDAPVARVRAREGQSVAVLPFTSMSPDPADAYFADGITEEIINVLAQIEGLRVAARTSSFAVRGNTVDHRVIGEQLGVRHVLEGSVRKAGTRLRITAQLIDSANGYHVWSERYDRDLVDVFALQDEIANAIAVKLRLSLLSGSGDGAVRAGPRNVEAYELLLKGRVLLWQRGRAILEALPCFERAVALDPELTEAHALIGDTTRLLWMYGMAPASATIPRALEAIDRALALDPENAQALTTLANIESAYNLDTEACVALADRVLARDPHHVQALCERAIILALRSDTSPQRMVQVFHHLSTARRVDPLNAWAAALEAMSLSGAGLPDDALRSAREAVAIDGKAFTGRWALVWTLSVLGHDEEAIALAEETLPMSGRNPRILAELAAIRARRGETLAVRAILDELRQRAATGYVEQSLIGAVSASAGELEEARVLVERGIAARETSWQFARPSPAWAAFRADATGSAMLRSMGY